MGMTATVVDLFSGAGGASAGFSAHEAFEIVGAADAQLGKPSSRAGSLSCNSTYEANIGISPVAFDLSLATTDELAAEMGLTESPDVLIACPPCTGYSRTLSENHLRDDPRNDLVRRTGVFVRDWQPKVLVMENARELVMGRYAEHLGALIRQLKRMGYKIRSGTHFLNKFGLPQKRERALIVAVRSSFPIRAMEDLWAGFEVEAKATHVRRAIWDLSELPNGGSDPLDPIHRCSNIKGETTLKRTMAIPHDGGSWFDLAELDEAAHLLTPTMKDRLDRDDLGSHPDVYGRMWWDRPSPTIKRECSHVGNGRYTHPEQDRLCSVREMAILNGFPDDYKFVGGLSNMYRHVGDAVPPLISFQLACLVNWILGGPKPRMEDIVLPRTSLSIGDIRKSP